MNVNELIFSGVSPKDKLSQLDAMSDADIRRCTNATMLRIYNACRGDRDRFYINTNRRAGNDWNSCIEFLFEHQGNACLMFYIQGGNTDTSTSAKYNDFNYGSRYRGSCRLGTFTYDADEITEVIRCILKEYVYYTYIEKDERESAERVEKLMHYTIVNPVYNRFYDEWRCKYEHSYPGASTPRNDRYYRAKKAVEAYVKEHVNELYGKSDKELQAIYAKIFEQTN